MPVFDLHRPVFIVGAASSGTTLLGVMLDRHSQFACGPELYALDKRHLYRAFPQVQDRFESWLRHGLVSDGQIDTRDFFHSPDAYFCDRDRLVQLMRAATGLREFLDAFVQQYLDQRGKQRWVEKTGSNAYYLDEILRLYPLAKVIHIVRDGRDVVCSLLRRDPRPFHAVSHWLYNASAAIAWRRHPAYFELRYEELVAQPERTLLTVCTHLGVAFEPQMLAADNEYWRRYASESIHASWRNDPLSGEVSTRSVGRHRHELTREVEALFWRLRLSPWGRRRLKVSHRGVADLMRLLGYVDQPPIGLRPVPLRFYSEGLRQFWRRARDNWACNRELWLPLVQVARS